MNKCETCNWFAPKIDLLGECRKYSPSVIHLGVNYFTQTLWPAVKNDDGCGDHAAIMQPVER